MKLSERTQQELRCPATKSELRENGDCLESVADPTIRYPVIDGIPILIDERRSLFSIDDFRERADTTFTSIDRLFM